MFVALSHVEAGDMKYALAIAADTSQGAPSDALEFSAAAGAGAFIMGTEDLDRRMPVHPFLYDRHAGLLAS